MLHALGMNLALKNAAMTREQFFPWAQAQDARYEFDGVRPVAMTGGTMSHKVREYQAVPSILRYVIVERTSIGLTVLERADGAHPWTNFALTADDVLRIPEVGIEVPVTAFYEDVELTPPDAPP